MKKKIENLGLIIIISYIVFAFSGAFAGYLLGSFINNIVKCTVYGFFFGVSLSLIVHYLLWNINQNL